MTRIHLKCWWTLLIRLQTAHHVCLEMDKCLLESTFHHLLFHYFKPFLILKYSDTLHKHTNTHAIIIYNREVFLLLFTFEYLEKGKCCRETNRQLIRWLSLRSTYLFLCFDIMDLVVQNWSRTRFLQLARHDGTLRAQNIGWTCVNSAKQTAGKKGMDVRQSHVFEMGWQVLQTVCFSLCVLKYSLWHIFFACKGGFFA